MITSVDELVSECFDSLHVSERIRPYIEKSESAGYSQLAKMFRAVVASETVREALLRQGMVHHATTDCDYYVCPHCGLIYDIECPDHCLVDETPGSQFIVVT